MDPAPSILLADGTIPAMETNPNAPAPGTNHRDYFSRLPHELLLMIISHHHPTTSGPQPQLYFLRRYENYRHFQSYEPVLALSRTCRQLHHSLTPELIRGLVSTEEGDPLGLAIKLGHLDLAMKLLKEGFLPATEERLVQWVDRVDLTLLGVQNPDHPSDPTKVLPYRSEEVKRVDRDMYVEQGMKADVVREAVVELLLEMGAGQRLGKEWHAMMGLHWEPGVAKTRKKPEQKCVWEVLIAGPAPRDMRKERKQVKYVEDEDCSENEETRVSKGCGEADRDYYTGMA